MNPSTSSVGPRTSRALFLDNRAWVIIRSARDVRGPTEEVENGFNGLTKGLVNSSAKMRLDLLRLSRNNFNMNKFGLRLVIVCLVSVLLAPNTSAQTDSVQRNVFS